MTYHPTCISEISDFHPDRVITVIRFSVVFFYTVFFCRLWKVRYMQQKSKKRHKFGVCNKKFIKRFQVWFIHEQLIWERLQYRTINKPRSLYFSKTLFEGIIFGGVYERRVICVSKVIELAYSGKEIYHFCFVLLCIWGQFPISPGGWYSEGWFDGWFFALRVLGAYIWRGLFSEFNYLKCRLPAHKFFPYEFDHCICYVAIFFPWFLDISSGLTWPYIYSGTSHLRHLHSGDLKFDQGKMFTGAFHLVKNSGISGSAVNRTRFVGSSHWKIPRKSGKSKKVGPFSRLESPNGISCSIYVSRSLHQFQDHGKEICRERDVPGFTTKWNNFLPIGNSTFAPTEISGVFS